MKVLVVTTRSIDADVLRRALGDGEADRAEVMVVAPALHETGMRFWMSDADEAIGRAREVAKDSVAALRDEGVRAAGDTGESDLMEAVADSLTTFPADRILLFTAATADRRHGEEVDADALRERFPVPVETHTL